MTIRGNGTQYTVARQVNAAARVLAKLREGPKTALELTMPERHALISLEREGLVRYADGKWHKR